MKKHLKSDEPVSNFKTSCLLPSEQLKLEQLKLEQLNLPPSSHLNQINSFYNVIRIIKTYVTNNYIVTNNYTVTDASTIIQDTSLNIRYTIKSLNTNPPVSLFEIIITDSNVSVQLLKKSPQPANLETFKTDITEIYTKTLAVNNILDTLNKIGDHFSGSKLKDSSNNLSTRRNLYQQLEDAYKLIPPV